MKFHFDEVYLALWRQILDLGCGPGEQLKAITQMSVHPHWEALTKYMLVLFAGSKRTTVIGRYRSQCVQSIRKMAEAIIYGNAEGLTGGEAAFVMSLLGFKLEETGNG